MTFWAFVLGVVLAVWTVTVAAAAIGAGIPLVREKIRRRKRGKDHE